MLAGALALGMHARRMASALDQAAPDSAGLAALQPLLGGARIDVPATGGAFLTQHEKAALLVAAGLRMEMAVRVDLCSQVQDARRPVLRPLRIGYPLPEVAAAAHAGRSPHHTVLLSAPGSTLPRIVLTGNAGNGVAPGIRIAWDAAGPAAWTSDATGGVVVPAARGTAALGRTGWLVWNDEALRFVRRASRACPLAGELLVQRYRRDASGNGAAPALVQAFPAAGASVLLRLAPGSYQVPGVSASRMEDQALFEQLRARGLLRLGKDGFVELAPRDLIAWKAALAGARAPLPGWDRVELDDTARGLLERLYRRADGDYLREQVRIFNSERSLVAWRVRSGEELSWQPALQGVPAARVEGLPVAAMRLFARLPEGWAPWNRVDGWGGGKGARSVILRAPAMARPVELLLVGRLESALGARASVTGICDGRACLDRNAVQHVVLTPEPGAAVVTLSVTPLDLAALSGGANDAYRHLRLESGQLVWRALPAAVANPPSGAAPVELADRQGAPLWADGRPTARALEAGLGPLLGLRRTHANSVAGMLARLGGTGHAARLSLDLRLQGQVQAVLDCLGMREGHWDGKRCSGGRAPAPERQAGLVLIDAERGDILAAASGGARGADPARWRELRDFDRADPARSLLRIAPFQHDGGAHRAPGSTFKVISALGLEQAARADARLEALLSGMPLGAIDRLARERGYRFGTANPAYPHAAAGARITNFRDRPASAWADAGRLGLGHALSHSINTWFAWTTELSDLSLQGRAEGGVPSVHALDPEALDTIRPVAGMARRLGFGSALKLDGGLLPLDYRWKQWDALQASAAVLDPAQTRHELRQMAIGLRMQATPLQMALVAAAVAEGRTVAPRLLLELDGRKSYPARGAPLGVRLDRVRAGMKGVVDRGTASGAFRAAAFDRLRPGLFGKTGTAPVGQDGHATVWFMGWLQAGSLPGQARPLAFAVFVSHSSATGGGHAAPVMAALLRDMDAPARMQQQ